MTLFIQQTNVYMNRGFGCPPLPRMMMCGPCWGMGSIWSKGATYGALTGIAAGVIIGSPKIRQAIVTAATTVFNSVLKPVGKFIGNIFSSAYKGIKSLFKKKDKSSAKET